jgi:metal transporter CNNM
MFMVLFSGLMSGLTVGFLSIDTLDLELKLINGSEKDKIAANSILPILRRHHILLVTLLLANAAALESLPIFLEKIVSPYIAIILSVTAILFFGEIVP